MIFLVSIILGLALGILLQKPLKKHGGIFYIITAVIAVAVVVTTKMGWASDFGPVLNDWVWPILSRGALATALFVIVMYTGALPNGSWLIKKLMPVRAELSIIATILTLAHNISYGMTYFKMLFTMPKVMPLNQILATICTMVMMCIMIPLCITSFKSIRKKMNPKSWKKLQRWAYVFYALIYIHVMLLVIPLARSGREGYWAIIIAYSVIFPGYAAMRLYKALKGKKILLRSVPAIVSLAIAIVVCAYSAPGSMASSDSADNVKGDVKNKAEKNIDEDKDKDDANISDGEKTPESIDEQDNAPGMQQDQNNNKDNNTKQDPQKDMNAQDAKDVKNKDNTNTSKAQAPQPNQGDKKAPVPAPAPQPQKQQPQPQPAPQPQKPQQPAVTKKYKDGSFTGSARGYNQSANITVSVTISNDRIKSVSVVSHKEDEPYWGLAKAVTGKIVAAQSADVSTVSGATFSSRGIINAARAAINKARN